MDRRRDDDNLAKGQWFHRAGAPVRDRRALTRLIIHGLDRTGPKCGVCDMCGGKSWRNRGLMALCLALNLAGCGGQTPGLIIDESGNVQRHEQLVMDPSPSAESTDESLWMDMQGGG
jgi:hypothetical protein